MFVTISTFAQNRTCLIEETTRHLIETDPEYAAFHKRVMEQEKNGTYDQLVRSAPCAASNKIILPMAVHYMGLATPNAGEISCLEGLALDQIQVLNDDYQGPNAFNFQNWVNQDASMFPGVSAGESCVEFCLPQQGHPTTLGDYTGSYAITINRFNAGANAPGWNGYINIYVYDIGPGLLGFSPYPGSGTSNTGVAISKDYFGTNTYGDCNSVGQAPPYNKGRTLTHELGHNLFLSHIWGGNANATNCGSDAVADTPTSASPYYGCPGTPATCGSTDMHMNYMDYVNDVCMYMFTAGQVTRMENHVNNNLQNVISNGLVVCASAPPTGCPPSYTVVNGNALTGSASQTGGSYNNGDYETDGDIESTQTIPAGTIIDYDSKTLICLNSGFNTSSNVSNTNFYAFIDGCNGGTGGGALTGDEDDGLQSIINNKSDKTEEKNFNTSHK